MNNRINCLIIDDEPVARRIVRNYCSHLPFLNITGECGNALEARESILAGGIDLLFLDIHMPVLNGVSFLNTLKHPPKVIFTTAFQDYAVNAFDLSAVDYLVKPFSLERFMVAVDKAKESIERLQQSSTQTDSSAEPGYLMIRSDGKLFRIPVTACLYAEAQANYTKLVTTEKTLLTKMSFTDFIAMLPVNLFIRIHRSFIINKNAVSLIEGNLVTVGDKAVPIAGNYKAAFLQAMGLP